MPEENQPLQEVREAEDQKKKDEEVLQKWKRRFDRAERFGKPYRDKNLRMYKLYRGYRDVANYAYNTKIMPPIGFEVIETIKPRLAAAKLKIRINPTKREDISSPSINSWDDLVNYNLDYMEFQDIKISWIDAMLKYGNGILQIFWNGGKDGDPMADVTDNWLLYIDPNAKERFKGAGYIIKWSSKKKSVIKKEEEERGEARRLYNPDVLEKVEDKSLTEDPRRDRYQINTLKMNQIDNGRRNSEDYNQDSATPDKSDGDKRVEIWECFDLVEGTITTIMNRELVARDEESAYADINEGNPFIDLPDIQLGWEYYAMGHLEPVETTIHEIADSRNQAMDDIVYSLDPIRKIRKGAGINASDIKHEPGAVWELANKDDVVIERPPEVSRMWVEKDELLRREIQTSLALSEYTQGSPRSGQEPAEKVDMLLMQSNIRFSLIVRQMEISFTKLVNALIQMNRKFIGSNKFFRVVGDGVDFKEFKEDDKKVIVDGKVTIEPKKEKTPDQKEREIIELYKIFVVDDQPDPKNAEDVMFYKNKKREFQKMILHEFDKEEYEDVLLPRLEAMTPPEPVQPEAQPVPQNPEAGAQPANIGGLEGGMAQQVTAELPQPIPLLEPEAAGVPSQPAPGLMQRLQGLFRS